MSWNEATNKGVLDFGNRIDNVKCFDKLWEVLYDECPTCADDQEWDDMKALYYFKLDGIEPGPKVITFKGKKIGKGVI